jgi:hypothetical protein
VGEWGCRRQCKPLCLRSAKPPRAAAQCGPHRARRRGKKGQKHFTVFVARVPPSVRSSFQPELNEEHTAWRWFPATQAALRSDLHPVVAAALAAEPNKQRVLAAIAAGEGPEAPGKGPAAAAAEPEQTAAAGRQPAERHGRGCSVA